MLFEQDPVESLTYAYFQGDVRDSGAGVGDGEEVSEFAPWPGDGNRTAELAVGAGGVRASGINEIAQLLGESGLSAARGVRGYLQRHRVEAGVVAISVTPDERLDLISGCHPVLAPPLACSLVVRPAVLPHAARRDAN